MTLARTAWHSMLVGAALAACSSPSPPTLVPAPQADAIIGSLFLIGDAGNPKPGDPVLAALTAAASVSPSQNTIVFLGDNIYPLGMPDSAKQPERADAEARIQVQIEVARQSKAHAWFVPGNHDWAKGGTDGWAAIQRQGAFLRAQGGVDAALLPEGGCPGPAWQDVPGNMRLILIDSQWWLQPNGRPNGDVGSCAATDSAAFVAALREAIAGGDGQDVVVASHHSYRTHGIHGGHFTIAEHVFPLREVKSWLWFPLPIIGSAYPIARRNGITDQDVSGAKYRTLLAVLADAFAASPPTVVVGGHDHNLQVLTDSLVPTVVVSGAGYFRHLDPVGRGPDTRFAAKASGFVRIDRLRDGRLRLGVMVVDEKGTREAHSEWIEKSVRSKE